jgi:hypothetical protein
MTSIAHSSAHLPQELLSLIEEGQLTLRQAEKLTISWGHEHPTGTSTPEIDDYVLASTIGGNALDFEHPTRAIGFLTCDNIDRWSQQKTRFDRIEKISLEEGRYFIRYHWEMSMAAYPSLWWRLAALRKGIIDPEGWLFSASQSDIDTYATDFDIADIKQRNFMKSIGMDSKNLFGFPYFKGKNYPSSKLCCPSDY